LARGGGKTEGPKKKKGGLNSKAGGKERSQAKGTNHLKKSRGSKKLTSNPFIQLPLEKETDGENTTNQLGKGTTTRIQSTPKIQVQLVESKTGANGDREMVRRGRREKGASVVQKREKNGNTGRKKIRGQKVEKTSIRGGKSRQGN